MQDIYLKLMTNKMYHQYFKEYQNDPDLYLNKDEYYMFTIRTVMISILIQWALKALK